MREIKLKNNLILVIRNCDSCSFIFLNPETKEKIGCKGKIDFQNIHPQCPLEEHIEKKYCFCNGSGMYEDPHHGAPKECPCGGKGGT